MFLFQWHWRHLKVLRGFFSHASLLHAETVFYAWKYLTSYQVFSSCRVRTSERTWNILPGTWLSSRVTDLFVGPTCHNSSSDPSHRHVVFGCAFPIDYLAAGDETGGEGWESVVWESVCGGDFSNLAGCGQLDHRFEFLLTARLKFQPLKIEGNKRLGLSKQPLRVVSFPPFPYFSCPSSFAPASARLRRALVW